MKICKIYIGDYKQFKRLELDFTHPETGRPLDKICFIGRNGTGKSNLLELINRVLKSDSEGFPQQVVLKIYVDNKDLLVYWHPKKLYTGFVNFTDKEEQRFVKNYFDYIETNSKIPNSLDAIRFIEYLEEIRLDFNKFESDQNRFQYLKNFYWGNSIDKLLINVYPEGENNSYARINDVPDAKLNNALKLFNDMPSVHNVSADFVSEFWLQLIYLIKKRENDRKEFEDRPENQHKTISQFKAEFDSANEEILNKLAELWNKILDSAGLEFDYKNAKKPVQLNDNLLAYIIHKRTREKINYSQLSTGIRNFIFKIGHIYSLYFNRKIDQGFLLVDEPENSLFPDFLYDLIDIYKEITTDKDGNNNTQMFFATHSPIIAAQFEPYERVILEWNDEGTISAHRGVAPVGDDPNDVLREDFEVRSLMTKKGQEAWTNYLNLKKEILQTKEEEKKKALLEEMMKIGTAYNF